MYIYIYIQNFKASALRNEQHNYPKVFYKLVFHVLVLLFSKLKT